MANRPDPGAFATYSYYLAFASAAILLLAFLIGLVPSDALKPMAHIIWLALLTSAIGAFLAFAARSDFRHQSGAPEDERRARTGLRVNLAVLVFMVLLLIFIFMMRLLSGGG